MDAPYTDGNVPKLTDKEIYGEDKLTLIFTQKLDMNI